MNSENKPTSKPQFTCISDQETTFQVIREAILGLWDVVNALTTIKPPKRKHYRVTVFGSARIEKDTPLYNDVKRLAMALTIMGCDIVTGGGPGLMEAANEGSVLADPTNQLESIGIRVNLDFEQETNPFVEQLYQHRTFFSRLHHFVVVSDAFIVVPGGIGTTLEALMVWQLLQVRHIHDVPLIMMGKMWTDFVDWATEYMVNQQPQLANPIDMKIPLCVETVDEVIALLADFHNRWQNEADPCQVSE